MIPILREVRWRSLLTAQVSELRAMNPYTGRSRLILRSSTKVIEAPDWSPDGKWLVFNAAGELWRMRPSGLGKPEPLPVAGARDLNNDHVHSPDGATLYVSCERDGHAYRVPSSGGIAERISPERPGPFGYFVIGVSPDGSTLGVTGGEPRGAHPFVSNLFLLSSDGGRLERLTDDDVDSIGCAWSADGQWLYFNSERDAIRPGHAQVYRSRTDGSGGEQLTRDERVNWFPKPSPRDDLVVWLSFEPGTVGHEANVPVQLKSMRPDGSKQRVLARFRGGQGTMNVSSWSPTGDEFAYVSYPINSEQMED